MRPPPTIAGNRPHRARLAEKPTWAWIYSDSSGKSFWIYALTKSSKFMSWRLERVEQLNQWKVIEYPSFKPEIEGNSFSYQVLGDKLFISGFSMDVTPFGFGLNRDFPFRVFQYDFTTGKKLGELSPPASGWPTEIYKISRSLRLKDGSFAFLLSGSGQEYLGRWKALTDLQPAYFLLVGKVAWMQPNVDGLDAHAVSISDDDVNLILLQDGSVADKRASLPDSRRLIPPVIVGSNGRPKFTPNENIDKAQLSIQRGGLEAPLPVTNVTLQPELRSQLDRISETFTASQNSSIFTFHIGSLSYRINACAVRR
jgi:hypothetical protein